MARERRCEGAIVTMTTIDFVPSQVSLSQFFLGTFDHAEAKNTAAAIVAVLAMNGDTWRVAGCEELADGFAKLTQDEGMWRTRYNNPFIRVDMHDLVKRGFAEWDNGSPGIRFTEAGLERMRKWVWFARSAGTVPEGA